jgi:predicted nucleotidyltransferase
LGTFSFKLKIKYMNNSEMLVSAFSNKELKTLVMALAAYNKLDRRETRSDLMEKLVNGFLRSNELEAQVIERIVRTNPYDSIPKSYWGTANGKAYLAEMEEASTKAYSY